METLPLPSLSAEEKAALLDTLIARAHDIVKMEINSLEPFKLQSKEAVRTCFVAPVQEMACELLASIPELGVIRMLSIASCLKVVNHAYEAPELASVRAGKDFLGLALLAASFLVIKIQEEAIPPHQDAEAAGTQTER